MPGGRRKSASDRWSPAERAAQAWHKKNHADSDKKCWCCCIPCKMANPHNAAARRAAVEDIIARLIDSIWSAKLPAPEGKRML